MPSCALQVARLEGLPALPGDPELEGRRGELFLRARAHPVLLKRAPAPRSLGPRAAAVRAGILGAPEPVKALYAAYPRLRRDKNLAREVLLTEGYLYSARPWFAAALSNAVRLEHLFAEPEIFLQRGNTTFRLSRRVEASETFYAHADGPFAGRRAKLLLLDRVANAEAELADPVHVDVGELAKQLGFQSLRPVRLTAEGIVAELGYGDERVLAVLAVEGSRVTLRCEIVPAGREARVAEARDAALRHDRAMQRLRAVMEEQVEENLPFDEPKTEYGQEDGKLRQHWRWAYRQGATTYEFNGDRYRVFDPAGHPRVPQVCIDFIRDTFERAAGSWYRPRGEPRERSAGALDFDALGIANERSVEHFVAFARSRPDWFEVYDLKGEERVPFARRAEFFADIVQKWERYRPGDVVVIYGLRDDEKLHYHTFFVYEADSVSGVPSLVAANAGRPRIRPLEGEMLSAPRRSILTRLRPRLEWLESLAGKDPI